MKVRYDATTGRLGKAYAENMAVPEPYIILSIADLNEIANKEDKIAYVVNGVITYKEKADVEAEEAAEKFNKEFFNTSLGYIRRKVTMKDGSVKDFLTDILPLLQIDIPILTYDAEGNQSKVIVTDVFLQECKQQLLKDFYGV